MQSGWLVHAGVWLQPLMGAWLLTHESALRLAVFVLVFAVLALWQTLRPFRELKQRTRRWTRHLGVLLIGAVLVRLCVPLAASAAGAWADAAQFGLLQFLGLPHWLLILSGIVLLDLAIYWQHRLFHKLPWLWRLHRMHHSDTAFEVSTGIRFHPLEIALSTLIKIGVVLMLGIPALGVLLFEILLNATALFSHSNVQLPSAVERRLRPILVTPDMHRIHHSTVPLETNSNFGFCLSIWDRWFGSYRAQAMLNPAVMPIGIEEFRGAADQTLRALLVQPLR